MPLTPTPPHSLKQIVEAVTTAAIAAVDRHLAYMDLRPAPITQPTGSVAATTHPAAISPDTVPSFVRSASVAPPPPLVGTVKPYIYSTVTPAPVPTLPPGASREPRGPHRTPRSGLYEDRPPPCDLVRPRLKWSLDTAPPMMSAF